MKVIKEYKGKLGTITITFYEDANEYCVTHSNPVLRFVHYWNKEKTEAIMYAQFLYAKY